MTPEPILANVLIDYFIDGGPVMWPILFCMLAALTVIAERILWWATHIRRTSPRRLNHVFQLITEGRFAEALSESTDPSDPFLSTIHEGLKNAHSSLLGAMQLRASDELEQAGKRLWLLSTFITMAPLLGLIGTVVGIMQSFAFLGVDELTAEGVSGGITKALITTACGMGIAIACLLPYNYFNSRLSQLRTRLERTINHVELIVESARHHGHDLEAFSRSKALADRERVSRPHESSDRSREPVTTNS